MLLTMDMVTEITKIVILCVQNPPVMLTPDTLLETTRITSILSTQLNNPSVSRLMGNVNSLINGNINELIPVKKITNKAADKSESTVNVGSS